jgi:predicted AlkP superfamily pyrophosphatase or phosphodiesterase
LKKLVLIWFDAFSDRYLSPELCPFLCGLREKHFFSRISPLFAYIGIEYSFELGLSINTHKIWNDHIFAGFDGKNAHTPRRRLVKGMLQLVDSLSPSDGIDKIMRFALFKAGNVEYGTPHLIPASLLDSFPVIKGDKRKNLYEMLRHYGVRYLKREPRLNILEYSLIKSIPKLLRDYDALFFKLNSLDRLGHERGPSSDVVKNRVRYVDGLLRKLDGELKNQATLMIISDHGMVPVVSQFDLISFLRSKGFEYGHHYVAFVGATYTSFWFKDKEHRNAILKDLSTLKVGRFLNGDDRVRLGIEHIGREYGEEIYVADEHTVFFPEFYHRRSPPKGMHGYAFGKYDNPVFFTCGDSTISLKKDKIDFIDCMPTILRLLDLPVPQHVEGRSLI